MPFDFSMALACAPPGGDYQLLGEGIPLVHPQIMIALVITLISLFPTPALVYGSITPWGVILQS